MSRDERLLAAISVLVEVFQPGKPLTVAARKAYRMALAPYSIDAIEAAAAKALRQDRAFMPKPGELIALMGDQSRAAEAWQRVDFAVRTVSEYGSPKWDDPLIAHAVKRIGGWSRLCNAKESDFDNWIRREFIAEYEALQGCELPNIALDGIHAKKGQSKVQRVACKYVEAGNVIEVCSEPSAIAGKVLERLSAPNGK